MEPISKNYIREIITETYPDTTYDDECIHCIKHIVQAYTYTLNGSDTFDWITQSILLIIHKSFQRSLIISIDKYVNELLTSMNLSNNRENLNRPDIVLATKYFIRKYLIIQMLKILNPNDNKYIDGTNIKTGRLNNPNLNEMISFTINHELSRNLFS